MNGGGRVTQADSLYQALKEETRLYLILLLLSGGILFALGTFLPGDNSTTLKDFLAVIAWIGNTFMATALVLGVSEIKPFRIYLEQRIARAFKDMGPEAIGAPLTELIRTDFITHATDESYLRQFDVRAIRESVVRASIRSLDKERESILTNHVYPAFERAWRYNLELSFSVEEDAAVKDHYLVTHDHSWTYVNSTDQDLTITQNLGLSIAVTEESLIKQMIDYCQFETSGVQHKFDWQISREGSNTILKTTLSFSIPPGETACRYRQKYHKPTSDRFYLHTFNLLTKNVTVNFAHPKAMKPQARAFFLAERPMDESIVANTHKWHFRGWFLEKQGLIVFWPQ